MREGDPNLCRVYGPNDPRNCRGALCLPPPIIVKNGRVIELVRAKNGRLIEKKSERALAFSFQNAPL
jgi:hypothetical protein